MSLTTSERIKATILTVVLIVTPTVKAFDARTSSNSGLAYDAEATCKLRCDSQIERRPAFIEIDANTGEVLNGTTKSLVS